MVFLVRLGFSQPDAFQYPSFRPDMTENPDQQKKWRKGLSKYSAKPKAAWELGVHSGHFIIDGDVDRRIPSGFGVGLHLRKAIQYVFSVRLDLFYGQAYGVEAQLWTHSSGGGGLVEPLFSDYENTAGWFPKVRMHYAYANFQTIINIGNILFHQDRNNWNFYLLAGAGLDTHMAMLDLFQRNGQPYDVQSILDLGLDDDIRDERIMIKKEVDNLYDGEYETEGFQKEGIYRVADKYNLHLNFIVGAGLSRKLNKRVNIGFEHQAFLSDNDYLDGMKYRSSDDQSNNVDIGHYTSLRVAINLGNLQEKTEPLYWLNPLDAAFNDIAELKQRPVLDLTDSDGDGVVDMMDMEPNSPVGAQVDTRGITLDSDSDGIPDFEDKEPFSAPGIPTDAQGVAQVPEKSISKEQVKEIVKEVIGGDPVALPQGNPDWFLPMIHFDLDKYYIKPQFLGQLKHVADIMKKYPDLCITAQGHTDIRNSNEYNRVLSYRRAKAAVDYITDNYGISRDRFRLMYGGEEFPLVPGLPDHHNITREEEMKQYMNRRVEFRTCQETDFDMPEPENLPVGSGTPGSSRQGAKYSGNKNAGY
jgi:outer membrane protein OmpA-like peptidoglycan-associated protein